ncbi:ParA family protein [Paludicola sp. MB14-C6]|uniref:ParA family protein n=1 Tax=Paludihabitans sp. MB14-C6 TaxID=3070656 RepID=UPI0027DDEA79|nr:ParA family protein [Paludicola sp. MB14-C6]WMJ24287.1 ParA family protein [Paludicola sp. MB14-C6]
MSKIIAVVNQKGGVAKTTTTNAFGIGLANKGYKVLLIDLDSQGNLSMSLGINFPDNEEYTIAKLMLDKLQEKETAHITAEYIHTIHGVDFIVGNDDLHKIDRMLSGFQDGEYALESLLSDIKNNYDYIIIDCMPNVGNLTENAIVAADELIIPSEPQYFSTKGIQSLFDEIGKIKRRKNPNLQIAGILPTRVDIRTNIAKEFLTALREVFGSDIHIFNTSIPFSTKLAECNDGKNIYEYDKAGKGVQAYIEFVDEYLLLC